MHFPDLPTKQTYIPSSFLRLTSETLINALNFFNSLKFYFLKEIKDFFFDVYVSIFLGIDRR